MMGEETFEDWLRSLSATATAGPWDEDAVSEEFRSASGSRADADAELVVMLRNRAEQIADLVASVRELREAPRDGSVDIAALHRKQETALDALDERSDGKVPAGDVARPEGGR